MLQRPRRQVALSLLIAFVVTASAAQSTFQGDFLPNTSGFGAPWAIAVADFNGDGKLDAATVDPLGHSVTVYLGNGDGTFQLGNTYTITGGRNYPLWVTTADVNGDGKRDLLIASMNFVDASSGKVTVLLGNGDGTFQAGVDYAAGSHPTSIVAADFNGDGKPDVAVNDNANASVLILLNHGDGTLEAPVSYPAGSTPISLATADFNGDGKADLVVANYCDISQGPNPALPPYCGASGPYGSTVSVLLGNGDGTFQATHSFPAGPGPYDVIVADLNKDRKEDIVVVDAEEYANSISVLMGNGDDTFQLPVSYDSGALGFYSFVVAADFNGDGNLDLVNGLTEFLGNGDGTFQPGVMYYFGQSGQGPVAAGDFRGDGSQDLVVAQFGFFLNAAGAVRQSTTTTVQATDIMNFGNTAGVTLNATVLSPSGPLPTGTVTLQQNGQLNQQSQFGPLGGSGNATSNSVPLAAGTNNISAVYSGDASTQASTGSISVTVPPASSSLSLTSSPNPSLPGQAVIFAAELTTSALISPGCRGTFTISFLDGSSVLGQNTTGGEACDASFGTTTLAVGSHNITASFAGNGFVVPAVSPVLIQVVNAGPGGALGLGVAPGSSSSATVTAGGNATYTLVIGGAVSGTASLTCTGAPTGASCSLPATANMSPTLSSIFHVKVTTTSRSSAALHPLHSGYGWLWAVVVFGISFAPISIRKGKLAPGWRRILPLWLLLFVCSCGGGNTSVTSGGGNGVGTPAGTYTLSVTAAVGTASQSIPLTLIVQ